MSNDCCPQEVQLGMTSYVINKGHRLRITVTSSFWPFYSVREPSSHPKQTHSSSYTGGCG